jgi:two-component system LytT family sensor kinase
MPLRIRRVIQLGLGASAVGLATTTWFYAASRLEGSGTSFMDVAQFFVPFCFVWALFLPVVLWMAKLYPVRPGRVVPSLLRHVPLAFFLAFVNTTLRFILQLQFSASVESGSPGQSPFQPLLGLAAYEAPLHFLVYGAILGAAFLADYARRLREREVATARLSAQLAQAQLQALRMQLNPHFLFNALNGVVTLVRDGERERAVRMLVKLSELLRYVLDESGGQEVPLKTELGFVERYLQLEQIRFSDRFSVTLDIDPETTEALVPSLLLQPVVENAVRHGIARQAGVTGLIITAKRNSDRLQLTVVDDGPGFDEDAWVNPGKGMGIRNTRTRLAQMYGDDHSFSMERVSPRGTAATISIPFRVEGSTEEEDWP